MVDLIPALGETPLGSDLAGGAHAGRLRVLQARRVQLLSERSDPGRSIRTRVSWDGPAAPEVVGQARRAVTAFAAVCGIAGAGLDAVRACVSEAVTNAVMQPSLLDGRPGGAVEVCAEFSGEALDVVVSAEGIGFLLSRDCSGEGMRLGTITALADSMSFATRAGGGNRLSMTFQLADPDPPPAG